MLKRLYIAIIVVLAGVTSAWAYSVNSTNIDQATIDAMYASYGAAEAMELMYQKDMEKITNSYVGAQVAMATIFTTKWMDRKALTNLDLWSEDENYYYRRIYNLVFTQILPKVIIVTGKCMQDPSTALYWGSYIAKVCSETQRLCMEFESVVTNGRLSFRDIPFLDFKEEFKKLTDLTKLGHVDWKEQFKDFQQNFEGVFSEEALQNDYDMLYEMGLQLASAGVVEMTNQISPDLKEFVFGSRNDNFVGVFQNNVGLIKNMVTGTAFDLVDASMTGLLNSAFGRDVFQRGDATALLTSGSYNLEGWISNYVNNSPNKYYTQKATITGEKKGGAEVICDYTPDHTKLWEWGGNRESPWAIEDWTFWESYYQHGGGFPDKFNDGRLLETVAKKSSEDISGWSQERVRSLNNSQSEYIYKITYTILDYRYGPGSHDNLNPNKPNEHHGDYDRAVGYKIKVTRELNINEIVYEEVFDSYKMEWTMFENKVKTILDEYNREAKQEGSPYYGMKFTLTYGPKVYYTRDDADRLKGATSCKISLECYDDIDVAEGEVQWKCEDCDGYGDSHMKECSMSTTLSSPGFQDEFSPLIDQKEAERQQLVNRQKDINNQRNEIIATLSQPGISSAEQKRLRDLFTELTRQSQELTTQIDAVDKELSDLKNARAEAEADYLQEDDNYDRIPAIEKRMETIYGVRWSTNGAWSREGDSYIYTRKGKPHGYEYDLTFEARVSIYSPAKYFLGIKYHRAKVRISWSLKGHGEEKNTVDNIDLDPEASPESQAEIVNARVDKLREQYPSCTVITEYKYKKGEEQDDTEDTYHLLWASDRMEIARHIEARLTALFADLVTLEKFLYYKHNIIDWLHDMVPFINNQFGRRHTIAEECRRRWMHSSGSRFYDDYIDERKDTTNMIYY